MGSTVLTGICSKLTAVHKISCAGICSLEKACFTNLYQTTVDGLNGIQGRRNFLSIGSLVNYLYREIYQIIRYVFINILKP